MLILMKNFLEKRVRDAWEYRKKVVDTGCCRLIFAEADFLPGIVVDKFFGCTGSSVTGSGGSIVLKKQS